MKALLEKLYTLTVACSSYLIPAFVFYKVIAAARIKSGNNLQVALFCAITGILLLALLYILRYCIVQICSRLFPFIIDGDRLIKDYGVKFTKSNRDKYVDFTFDDGKGSDGIVTLIAKEGSAFVENVVSSNSNLSAELGDIGWEVENVSPASPGDMSYIVKFGRDRLYLSEDQLLDLFSYLMVRHYVEMIDADMIDNEIEKYCTGLGLVPSAR